MIAIYSRKSKFTGKGESIGNQMELCKEYVRNMFGEAYVDCCVVFYVCKMKACSKRERCNRRNANGILDDSVMNIQPLEPVTRGEAAGMFYALLDGALLLED